MPLQNGCYIKLVSCKTYLYGISHFQDFIPFSKMLSHYVLMNLSEDYSSFRKHFAWICINDTRRKQYNLNTIQNSTKYQISIHYKLDLYLPKCPSSLGSAKILFLCFSPWANKMSNIFSCLRLFKTRVPARLSAWLVLIICKWLNQFKNVEHSNTARFA